MERSRIQVTSAALVAAACVLMGSQPGQARSAADLSARLVVDGHVGEWDSADRVFRLCTAVGLADSCRDEERPDDSAWSELQELHQIYVTWDAQRLYVAVTGQIAGHALLLLLDFEEAERRDLASLERWRRALRFGPEMSPDAFLALRDGQRHPELWLLPSGEAMQPVDPADFEAVSAFEIGAFDRGLEAAIPWRLLFPRAASAVNPDSLAPAAPMFVLPPAAAWRGLRLLAAVVHAEDGLGVADLAPDARQKLSMDPRTPVVADRAVRVDWSDAAAAAPHFVRFDFALQEQGTPRFVPDAPGSTVPLAAGAFEVEMTTERAGSASHEPTRVVVPDRGLAIDFVLRAHGQVPSVLYVSSRILSLRGETVWERADVPVSCAGDGTPCQDERFRWDGRDATGAVAPGGTYVWRVDVGASPGTRSLRLQRSIVVVH